MLPWTADFHSNSKTGHLWSNSYDSPWEHTHSRFKYRLQTTTSCKNVETLTKKQPFKLQIAASHRSVRYNTDLPPPSHCKLFFQVCSALCQIASFLRCFKTEELHFLGIFFFVMRALQRKSWKHGCLQTWGSDNYTHNHTAKGYGSEERWKLYAESLVGSVFIPSSSRCWPKVSK